MSKKLNKVTAPKYASKTPFAELTDNFKLGLFNHEECKKLFEQRIKDARLKVSEHTKLICETFLRLLPELSDATLNLSDKPGEYEQLIALLRTNHKVGTTYETHQGIFMLMVNQIRRNAGKMYMYKPMNLLERENIFIACRETFQALEDMLIPVKDACISEFYESATPDQLADVRAVVKHHEQAAAGGGMPGNGGVPQFRG